VSLSTVSATEFPGGCTLSSR